MPNAINGPLPPAIIDSLWTGLCDKNSFLAPFEGAGIPMEARSRNLARMAESMAERSSVDMLVSMPVWVGTSWRFERDRPWKFDELFPPSHEFKNMLALHAWARAEEKQRSEEFWAYAADMTAKGIAVEGGGSELESLRSQVKTQGETIDKLILAVGALRLALEEAGMIRA